MNQKTTALCVILLFFCSHLLKAQDIHLESNSFRIGINKAGNVFSLVDKQSAIDYAPVGKTSPLLSLFKDGGYIYPVAVQYKGRKLILTFSNQSRAVVNVVNKGDYLRFQVESLSPRNNVEAVVWGPYKTTIQEKIGETVCVVRNEKFAIGMQALDINTIEGVPGNGDNSGGGSFIDPLPGQQLPDSLKDKIGQQVDVNVNVTGDMPEYVRMYRGSAAVKIPAGSELRLFSRDRKTGRIIGSQNNRQYVQPVDVDFIGSAIALFGCPEPEVLDVIEKIEIQEKLPHPLYNGTWIKRSTRPGEAYMMNDLTEHAAEYAKACGFTHIHAGDIFNTWGHFDLKSKRFPGGAAQIKAITDAYRKQGITIGVHTLTMFTGANDAYITPIPNDSLCKAGSSQLSKDISENDKVIFINEPDYFRNPDLTHSVKIGKELISYEKVSDAAPWCLLGCVRGKYNTTKSAHSKGDSIDKLVNNDYKDFYPDINLQDAYAKRLAQVCNETGIDLMDFDGFGGGYTTAHGTYSDARFVDLWYKNLDRYRLTCGAGTSHYYWHIYALMNWGEPWYSALRESQVNYRMENQRYFDRNLMPGMLGWFSLGSDYRPEEVEWIQARSAAYNAGYLLGINESIEKSGYKNQLFDAVKQWQNARKLHAFSAAQIERMKNPKNEFHLQKITENSWDLYPLTLARKFEHKYRAVQTGEPILSKFSVANPYHAQPMQFYATVSGKGTTETISNLTIDLNEYQTIEIQEALKAGDKIICDGNALYLCDGNWNKLKEIKTESIPAWKVGENSVVVKIDFSGAEAPALMLEFKMMGMPERVGK